MQLADPVSDLVLTRHGSLAMIHRTDLIIADGATVSHLDGAAEPGSLAYAARVARVLLDQRRRAALRATAIAPDDAIEWAVASNDGPTSSSSRPDVQRPKGTQWTRAPDVAGP